MMTIALLDTAFFFLFFQLEVLVLNLLSYPLAALSEEAFYSLAALFIKLLVFFCGISVRVSGQENLSGSRRLILAGNHPGFLEPLYVIAFFPLKVKIITSAGMKKMPFLSRVLDKIGCLAYQEKGPDMLFAASLVSTLGQDKPVMIFTDSNLTRLARLAAANDAAVVPFYVKQPGEAALAQGLFVSPGRVSITIGRPVLSSDLAEPAAGAALLTDRFAKLKEAH